MVNTPDVYVYVRYIKAQLVISHKSMQTHEVDVGDNQFQEVERLWDVFNCDFNVFVILIIPRFL